MPTENEIIFNLTEPSSEEVVDLASFGTQTIEVLGEGLVRVSVPIDNSTEILSIIVRKDITCINNVGDYELELSKIDQERMEVLIDDYNICFISMIGWCEDIEINDVVYCTHDDTWIYKDDAIFGYINRYDEGYFHVDEDYIRCADSDNAYINCDVAERHECYYCNNCEEYRNGGCDGCDDSNGEDDVYFNNQHTNSYNPTLASNKKWGTDSPTFSMSNGMRYTFGIEIETSDGTMDRNDWEDLNISSMYDGSTSGPEYVTGVLKGDYGFNHLKKVCNAVKNSNHQTNSRCGVHVHVGGVFNRRFTIMLLRLSYQLQDEVFRMMPPSRINNTYCKYIPTWASKITFQDFREKLGKFIYNADTTLDKSHNKKHRHDKYASTRYRWVNINNFSTASGRPTVEFRNHGATMSYEKIRNWTLICMSIVRYAESNQKRIYNNVESITLKDVLIDGLGVNIASQVYKYYEKRVSDFKYHYEEGGIKHDQLPSQIIDRVDSIQ